MIQDAGTVPVTHFTCIGNTREGIKDQLQNYLDNGVDHMLALRGDLPFGWTGTGGDFKYATDLVAYVRKEFGDKIAEIAVAGSPEGHISCRSLDADVAVLKQKQDNGADYIMTQLSGIWNSSNAGRIRSIKRALPCLLMLALCRFWIRLQRSIWRCHVMHA